MSRGRWVLPGAGRITLVLLLIVPAAMTYPWRTASERWVLGIAVVVTIVLLSWWRGLPVTTILWRRLALLSGRGHRARPTDALTTVVLRVLPERDDELSPELPLPLLAEYLDRYGIRCDAIRVTSRDTAAGRTTWIGLTLSAVANLAALQARSADIALRDTAEIALRRLADHLREYGWAISTSDIDVPDLLGPDVAEKWRVVQDGTHGYVTAYGVASGAALAEVLAAVWSSPSPELWTALELTGVGDAVQVSVACAVRTGEVSDNAAPLPGLIAQRGRQRSALAALHPLSTEKLSAPTTSGQVLAELSWPANRVPVRT